jgi:hypothetical protein
VTAERSEFRPQVLAAPIFLGFYSGWWAHHLYKEGRGMDRFVARENIAHLRDKLVTEQDEVKRQSLLRLLAEEEAKLAVLENNQPKKKRRAI